MKQVKVDKELFRKESKLKIVKFMKHNKFKRDKQVVQKLLKLIKKRNYKNILMYIPLESEVDIYQLIRRVRGKCSIFVPFMEGVSFKMVEFRLPLFKKKFNLKEPKNSFARVSKLDLAIVPVLGVDGAFKRIGFGAGMYDRFFESLSSSPDIVFVQLGKCFCNENICESHDIQADIYMTPYKTMIKRGKNDNRIKYSCCRSNF
jgi:5-formyltetrahydrofolate cyclo-ligase